MKKKILVFALALVLAVPVLASAKNKTNHGKTANSNANNTNSTSFTIKSVTPTTIENNADTTITITGTGFGAISIIGVKLGVWEDSAKDTTDDSVLLSNIHVVGDITITATIPAGTHAQNNQDLTVFDSGVTPNAHYTLANAITIHPSFIVNDTDTINASNNIMEVYQSASSSSKATFSLTVKGKSFKNKRWLKVRVGSKKAVITKVARSGNDTVVSVKYRYGKLAVGDYNISLTYKDRLKKGVVRKNKTTYRNVWENGTITANNAFSIMLQPIQ